MHALCEAYLLAIELESWSSVGRDERHALGALANARRSARAKCSAMAPGRSQSVSQDGSDPAPSLAADVMREAARAVVQVVHHGDPGEGSTSGQRPRRSSIGRSSY